MDRRPICAILLVRTGPHSRISDYTDMRHYIHSWKVIHEFTAASMGRLSVALFVRPKYQLAKIVQIVRYWPWFSRLDMTASSFQVFASSDSRLRISKESPSTKIFPPSVGYPSLLAGCEVHEGTYSIALNWDGGLMI